MVIVSISGGLGNQMFQYAFSYSISQKTHKVTKLDINNFQTSNLRKYELELFNISTHLISKAEAETLKFKNESVLGKILRQCKITKRPLSDMYYKEPHFNFDKNVYLLEEDVYFKGYWQSEKYFHEYKENLIKQFTLKNELHLESQQYQKMIKKKESISLHIRHGDYVTNKHTNNVHGICSLDYYKNSVSTIEKKIKNAHFFIFSDDLNWAKENLNFIKNITFIELSKNIPDHEEMYLMSQCKHNIIANSSFSWWGAWLNPNDKKMVIAPKKWFNDTSINTSDLIPEGWLCL